MSSDIDSGAKKIPTIESMVIESQDVESAKEKAAKLWGISEDDITAEIVEDQKRFFGLLGKKLIVKVESSRPVMYLQARDFVSTLMKECSLDLDVELDEELRIDISGDDSAIMIGHHGATLKAFEFLTNLIFRPDQELPKIRFDCGGYKDRREDSLMRLARATAREAVRTGAPIRLEPMSGWERRIIHMALQDVRSVTTYSVGEDPTRCVVVAPGSKQETKPERHRGSHRRSR